jgi:hypothetical protein
MKLFLLAVTASTVSAFAPSASQIPKTNTQLHETFGLGLGEDTYENQPDLLKGEQEYKQYVNRISEENMLNRKVGKTLQKRKEPKNPIGTISRYPMFSLFDNRIKISDSCC